MVLVTLAGRTQNSYRLLKQLQPGCLKQGFVVPIYIVWVYLFLQSSLPEIHFNKMVLNISFGTNCHSSCLQIVIITRRALRGPDSIPFLSAQSLLYTLCNLTEISF